MPTMSNNSNSSTSQAFRPGIHLMSLDEASSATESNSSQNTHRFDDFQPTFYIPDNIKHRRRTSSYQFETLQIAYRDTRKPDSKQRRALAEKLSMTPRSVQVWFQNRRAKEKNSKKNGVGQRETQARRRSASSSQSSVSTCSVMHNAMTGGHGADSHRLGSIELSESLGFYPCHDSGDENRSERSHEDNMLMTPITHHGVIPNPSIEPWMNLNEVPSTSPDFKTGQPAILGHTPSPMAMSAYGLQELGSFPTLMRPVENFQSFAFDSTVPRDDRVLNWALAVPNATDMLLSENQWDIEPEELQPPPQPCQFSVQPSDAFMLDPLLQNEAYWNHYQDIPNQCEPGDIEAFMGSSSAFDFATPPVL